MKGKIDKTTTPGKIHKLKDASKPCNSPRHNPPAHIVLSPGTYEYICPDCGHRIEFVVPYVGY